jgi:hypothetical protein
MLRKAIRWGADIGCQKKIKPLEIRDDIAAHGLRGRRAKGDLEISRSLTRREAQRDAADGLPVSEACEQSQWSEREQIIAERAEDIRRGLTTWLSATAAKVRNHIQDLTPTDIYPDQLKEAIKAEENEYRYYESDDTEEAREGHSAAILELESFREQHGQQIGERRPDIKKNIEQAIAILILLMLIEGSFNALLFKDAQASGIFGGLIIAFAVGAINVLCGVVGGFFGLRYLHHPNMAARIAGGAVAGISLLAGLFLNFFVAHFRDAVEAGLAAAAEAGQLDSFSMFAIAPGEVLTGMLQNVFGFESFVALALLLLGLTIYAIAAYEGYDRISDRYPGYGRVWRKERRAYEYRQQVREALRDDLSDYFSSCRKWIETQLSRHAEAKREIEKAMNLLDMRREVAASIAARSADQERSLKVAYRQAHRRQRNALRDKLGEQAACPAYFDEIVTPQLPAFDFSKERAQATAAIKTIDQNITGLNLLREWLEKHIQDVQQGLSSVERKVSEEITRIREQRDRADRAPGSNQAKRA